MREFETKQITSTVTKCVRQACDLCGREAADPSGGWERGIYEINETKISVSVIAREGESYPEGSHAREIEIDLCPECFRNRLIPWLRSQGATVPEAKEISW